MNKTKILIICGGQSEEHEVSLKSAYNIARAISKSKYDIILIAIDKTGKWWLIDKNKFFQSTVPQSINSIRTKYQVCLNHNNGQLFDLTNKKVISNIDVAFPVLHGPFGEDGTIQGLLKLANLPFVGADVLGSAIGMDKDVMKRLLKEAKISIAPFLVYQDFENTQINFNILKKQLGLPFYIKPANLGSSVGISRVEKEDELKEALKLAFKFDHKIIIEKNIPGREIECSVLGNYRPIASKPGEIILNDQHHFYSYDAKYLDESGAQLMIPAKLPKTIEKKVQELAVQTFRTLCCSGLARVDFFLTKDSKLYVNEMNTIPGFTNISMYPKLWEKSGISYQELIERLIKLALDKFSKN